MTRDQIEINYYQERYLQSLINTTDKNMTSKYYENFQLKKRNCFRRDMSIRYEKKLV